jgi:hypothetical protein
MKNGDIFVGRYPLIKNNVRILVFEGRRFLADKRLCGNYVVCTKLRQAQ